MQIWSNANSSMYEALNMQAGLAVLKNPDAFINFEIEGFG